MNLQELLGDDYKEGMTVDEINNVLSGITFPEDKTAEINKLKTALSKSNSEAADYKRQLRAKQTDDEQKAQKEAEERAALEEKYNKLLHETAVSKNKAKLVSLGYEEKLADETAEAMVNGDMEKVFINQSKHQENLAKKIKADVLKDTPKPPAGDGKNAMTLEKYQKMNQLEKLEFSEKHPEEYKTLYQGGNE